MTNLIGQSFGRYHILEQLGEGGMATVYKAYDMRLERPVAVKVILPMREHSEKFLKRFEREAKSLAGLSHPNIVGVLDYGEHEGLPYIVMEYVPGGMLKEKLGKPMGWKEAAKLLAPVARALAYAHSQKMVHRDVKPANILLTQSGEPMLSDFGVAKILKEEKPLELTGTGTGAGVGVGTPEYMAPEQGMGKEVDGRTDVYSLGIVFYELVTGRKPYRADTAQAVLYKQMTEPLPHPKQYVGELPDGVVGVMLKALAKDPKDRYQDAGDFADALERLARGEVEGVWGEPVREAPRSRRIYWLAGGLVGLVVIGLGIGILWRRHGAGTVSVVSTSTRVVAILNTSVPAENITSTSVQASTATSQPTMAQTEIAGMATTSSNQECPNSHTGVETADQMQTILDHAQLIAQDNFTNPYFPGWTAWRPDGDITNPSIKDRIVNFISSSDPHGRTLTRNDQLYVGQAVQVQVQYKGGTNFMVDMHNGEMNSSNFRDWGYAFSPQGDQCSQVNYRFLEGMGNSQASVSEPLGISYVPDRWYTLLLWIKGQSDFVVRIWEKDNPNIFAEKELHMLDPEAWTGWGWNFAIYIDYGALSMTGFKEIKISPTP